MKRVEAAAWISLEFSNNSYIKSGLVNKKTEIVTIPSYTPR